MKRLIYIAIIIFSAIPAFAQQDPTYSQFMFNKLAFNPAYAGSHEQMAITLLARRQWLGFEGAPKTENISFHFPTANQRHGFGFNLVNDRLGYTNTTLATVNYAFIIPVGDNGHFSLGLNTGLKSYWARYSQVPLQQTGDAAFGNGIDFTKKLFVAGTGLYFHNDHFYVGASIPDLIPHQLVDNYYGQLLKETVLHSFVMAGAALPLGESFELRPSALLRMAKGAPIGLDLGTAIRFKDIVQLGAMWRPSNSLAFMTQIYFGKSVYIGYAYDLSINNVRTNFGSSHEFTLGIDLSFSKGNVVNSKLF